jgi:phosphate transport system substrate-binding protein
MIRKMMFAAALTTAVLASAPLTVQAQNVTLTGAGSSFAAPLYSKWAAEYKKAHSNVEINYQAIGSGGGIRQVSTGTVDFGGTDGPMTDPQLADAKNKVHTDILHFPTALGAAVPIYNIAGVSNDLKFTQDALAGIFLGKITKWNDPAIASVNPGVKLPAANIIVMHRADSSGTTYTWADFLSKVSPEWKTKVGVGGSLQWPVGLGGKGNDGVAGLVKQTPNSIGYVELVFAVQNKISYGEVRNSSGKFIKAGLASVSAAAAGAVKNMPADFRVSITDAPNAEAYPISTFTWMLVPRNVSDKNKAAVLKDFVKWSITTGQNFCEDLTYAKLPREVVAKEEAAIGTLQY